jgi:hypothetical protein
MDTLSRGEDPQPTVDFEGLGQPVDWSDTDAWCTQSCDFIQRLANYTLCLLHWSRIGCLTIVKV